MNRFPKILPLLWLFALTLGACTPASPATLPPADSPSAATVTLPPSATPLSTETPPPTHPPAPTATETPDVTPTKRPTPAPLFTLAVNGPIIPVDLSTYRTTYIEPGTAIFHGGQFHLFFNAFNKWPAHVDIGYASSTDGLTWDIHPDPLFSAETLNISYAPHSLYVSSVLVEEDSTWVLYFYTWDDGLASAHSVIGRATAPNPLGPWTADPQPLLTPENEAGYWDSFAVRHPAVVKTEAGYFMFYAGTDVTGTPIPQNDVDQIGLATSPDGLAWTKYDDPATTDKLYSRSDPVLRPNENKIKWDSKHTQRPAIAHTPDGFVLFYRSTKGTLSSGDSTAYGYALSEDGIHWTRGERNPVMRAGLFRAGPDMYATNMLYHDGMYYLFAEIGTAQKTEVFMATGNISEP